MRVWSIIQNRSGGSCLDHPGPRAAAVEPHVHGVGALDERVGSVLARGGRPIAIDSSIRDYLFVEQTGTRLRLVVHSLAYSVDLLKKI